MLRVIPRATLTFIDLGQYSADQSPPPIKPAAYACLCHASAFVYLRPHDGAAWRL
jgi:hypothetical protein